MLKFRLRQWGLAFACCTALMLAAPAHAQVTLTQILQTTPQTRLKFAPQTVGSVIAGGGNRIYILNAAKGQYLTIDIHSMGARAFVAVYDPNGARLKTLSGSDAETFSYELPASGDYYIFCYSGPTIHYYDFTVRIGQ